MKEVNTMKDVEFMTAEEKQLVLKQWQTFITNRCQLKHFTKRIYDHLNLHCSFIAHFNLQGFYSTYFEHPRNTIRFLTQFSRIRGTVSIEYGNTYWLKGDFEDLNTAMCEVVEKVYNDYVQDLAQTEKEADVQEALRLLEKHGYEAVARPKPMKQIVLL